MSDCSTHAFDVPLKPCPFCGGEAVLQKFNVSIPGRIICACSAEMRGYRGQPLSELIAAWNTRVPHGTLTAEQVSKAVYAHSIHADCADADFKAIADELNTRAERTCKCTTDDSAWCFVCSECGKSFPRNKLHLAHNHGEINYCPNCGARVMGE